MNNTIYYLLSHGCVLQFCISIGSPSHLFPPFLSGVTIVRVLPCIPPPQVRVHKSHLVQSLHSQSTTFQDIKMYCYVNYGPKYNDIKQFRIIMQLVFKVYQGILAYCSLWIRLIVPYSPFLHSTLIVAAHESYFESLHHIAYYIHSKQ